MQSKMKSEFKMKIFNLRPAVLMLAVLLSIMALSRHSVADIYILPCIYRVELTVRNTVAENIRTDFARVGSHTVGSDILYFRTWAEFDISELDGQTVTEVGMLAYNDWSGTEISLLRYTPVQPSVANQYQLLAQHNNTKNIYEGFNWTINPNDAWTPDTGFFEPDWNNHRRIYDNSNTLIDDLQAHIDDPSKSWFAVEFSYNGSNRANLRFPTDKSNPASVIIGVVTESELDSGKNQGEGDGSCETRPSVGDPINFSTGNAYHKAPDLRLSGPGLPFGYTRHYNSRNENSSYLGYGWTGSYSQNLTSDTDKIILREADGTEVHFIDNGEGKYISEADQVRVIEPVTNGHTLREPDGKILAFDNSGSLTRITDRNGNTHIVEYADGKPAYIEDNFGRRLDFSYNTDGFLDYIDTPAGRFSYTYNQGNLTSVTNPGMTGITYLYNDTNDPRNLTEVINENLVPYKFEYDDQDRAALSQLADGIYKVSIDFQDGLARTITNSLEKESVFELQAEKGIGRVKSSSGAGCGTCPGSDGSQHSMDDRLLIQNSTDAKGNITGYTYDDRGNVLTKTEASGTLHERTTTYTWHTDYNLATSITRQSVANPGQTTVESFDYDTSGNLEEITETGFFGTVPITRTNVFTFDSLGRITGIDGPRTDVTDTVTFEYYPNDASQGLNRAMLKKITNGKGHETLFGQYNAFGRPRQMTDPNSVITTFVYNARGWLTSNATAGYTTTFDYDNAGNLKVIHLPGSKDITYSYTDADLIEKIEDNAGNYIKYFYDTEGNKTREEVRDHNDVLKRYKDFEPDDFDRLEKIIYPGGSYEFFIYDGNSNLTQAEDANKQVTVYGYDELDRLTTITEPGNVITGYGYDSHDNLADITDGKTNTTNYTYDDFGRQVSASSHDTNTTGYEYDKADNATSRTDGNNITVTYQYDTLNRLTDMQFPDSSQDISYGYDAGQYGKDNLTSVTDPAGSTSYLYNALGQLTLETRVMNGVTYTTYYNYDPVSGDLAGMTYPSGLTLAYQRDDDGRITGITSDGQPVTKSVTYVPFGPVGSLTFGNDFLTVSRAYNNRYLLTGIQAGSAMNYQYGHDDAGNVRHISGITSPPLSAGITGFTHTVGNRLTEITGANPAVYTYDGRGNITSDGTLTFVYNQNNRLIQVKQGQTVLGEYAYDGFGRRVKKTVFGITTLFHYDYNSNLIAETMANGTPLRDIIYQNGERIAMKLYGVQAGMYYFLNDHLGTPQSVISSSGVIVWEAAYLPFGKAWVKTETITNNFRFPGQYYDEETGLHYNWNRYYNPDTRRYLTPDPIGPDPEVNLYAYSLNNPINYIDPKGLIVDGGVITIPVAAIALAKAAAFVGSAVLVAKLVNYIMNSSNTDDSRTGLSGGIGGTCAGMPDPDDEKSLRRLHSDDTTKNSNKSGYDYWSKQSTEDIVESLKPGTPESLKVKPDGIIMNGNTRILILEERGFDINSLMREMF